LQRCPRIDEAGRLVERRNEPLIRLRAEFAVEVAAYNGAHRPHGCRERTGGVLGRRRVRGMVGCLSLQPAKFIDLREPLLERIVFKVRDNDAQRSARRPQHHIERDTLH